MKKFLFLALPLFVIATSAKADFRPGRIRAEQKTVLNQVDGDVNYPRAEVLYTNFMDGKAEPVSFTLQMDTGIRCFRAPCPSQVDVEFKITNISQSIHNADVVRYEAVEVVKNIPANVRIAPRKLFVTEYTMEGPRPSNPHMDVELETFPNKVQNYEGTVEFLAVTM